MRALSAAGSKLGGRVGAVQLLDRLAVLPMAGDTFALLGDNLADDLSDLPWRDVGDLLADPVGDQFEVRLQVAGLALPNFQRVRTARLAERDRDLSLCKNHVGARLRHAELGCRVLAPRGIVEYGPGAPLVRLQQQRPDALGGLLDFVGEPAGFGSG